MASVWAQQQPGVEFEVKVVRVAGVEARPEGGGGLFVRYYVPVGDGKRRIRVDTREVPCGGVDGEEEAAGDAYWGELARFERLGGAAASVGGVVFELRWRPRRRSSLAFLGTGRPSSRVLARGELACGEDVAVAPAASSGTWLRLSPACRELGGCKAPKLLVEVRMIRAAADDDSYGAVKAKSLRGGVSHCCRDGERCARCGWIGTEEDMFLAATFTE